MTTPRPKPKLRSVPNALAAGVTLLLLLTACSGGDDGATTAAPEPQASATTVTTAAGTASTAPVDTTFTGRGSEEYCGLSRSYQDAQSRLGPGASADVRQLFQDAARDIRQAVAVAPAEIKPDVELVADGFNALVTALGNVNYDFTRLPPELIVRFMSPEFEAASTRVAAYARNVCGIN